MIAVLLLLLLLLEAINGSSVESCSTLEEKFGTGEVSNDLHFSSPICYNNQTQFQYSWNRHDDIQATNIYCTCHYIINGSLYGQPKGLFDTVDPPRTATIIMKFSLSANEDTYCQCDMCIFANNKLYRIQSPKNCTYPSQPLPETTSSLIYQESSTDITATNSQQPIDITSTMLTYSDSMIIESTATIYNTATLESSNTKMLPSFYSTSQVVIPTSSTSLSTPINSVGARGGENDGTQLILGSVAAAIVLIGAISVCALLLSCLSNRKRHKTRHSIGRIDSFFFDRNEHPIRSVTNSTLNRTTIPLFNDDSFKGSIVTLVQGLDPSTMMCHKNPPLLNNCSETNNTSCQENEYVITNTDCNQSTSACLSEENMIEKRDELTHTTFEQSSVKSDTDSHVSCNKHLSTNSDESYLPNDSIEYSTNLSTDPISGSYLPNDSIGYSTDHSTDLISGSYLPNDSIGYSTDHSTDPISGSYLPNDFIGYSTDHSTDPISGSYLPNDSIGYSTDHSTDPISGSYLPNDSIGHSTDHSTDPPTDQINDISHYVMQTINDYIPHTEQTHILSHHLIPLKSVSSYDSGYQEVPNVAGNNTSSYLSNTDSVVMSGRRCFSFDDTFDENFEIQLDLSPL